MTENSKPIHAKPCIYSYYFEHLKEIAKNHGYNLLIHGSIACDLDLVAVPWVDNPKDELEMINAFNKYLNGFDQPFTKEMFLSNVLPGGRNSYVINLNRGGYENLGHGMTNYVDDPQYYVDISVTPLGK